MLDTSEEGVDIVRKQSFLSDGKERDLRNDNK